MGAKPTNTPERKPGGATTAQKSAKTQVRQILDGFRGSIEPVQVSGGYIFGLALVAFVMVLLLAAYLAIVATLGAVVGITLMKMIRGIQSGGLPPILFFVFLIPWLLGLLFVLFLIKPLFAPSVEGEASVTLYPEDEPNLFEFLECVCEAVNSPAPSEVVVNCEVNAAAGFAGLFGIFTGRSRLTLGLPLIAGMNSQQLAGVIAHEFGHISQRVAMRFSLLIRLISVWLARVAYERDSWDYWLLRGIEELPGFLSVPLRLVNLMLAGVRILLSGFYMAGHFVSMFLLRQMEFNADLYEARLVGTRCFGGSTYRLHLLGIATQGANFDTFMAWKEKRLSDNYPALIAANVEQVSKQARDQMAKHLRSTETSLWDTHPSPRERVARVMEDNATAIYSVQQPPGVLFRDFDRLCKRVSISWYRSILGPQFNRKSLIPVAKLIERSQQRKSNWMAWLRYFQGLLYPARPLLITAGEVAPVPGEQVPVAKESVMRLRRALFKGLNDSERAYEKFHDYEDLKIRAIRAMALLDAGLEIDAESFNLPGETKSEVVATLRRAIENQRSLSQQLDRFETLQKKRLSTALSLLRTRGIGDKVPGAAEKIKTMTEVIAVGEAMQKAMPALTELRNDMHGFFSLVIQGIDWNEYPPLAEQMITKLKCVEEHLHTIRYRLCDQKYPFDHARGKLSIAKFLFDDAPEDQDDAAATLSTADMVIERTEELYYRLMEELSGIATTVERSLGLKPLPIPWSHPASEGFEKELDELEVVG